MSARMRKCWKWDKKKKRFRRFLCSRPHARFKLILFKSMSTTSAGGNVKKIKLEDAETTESLNPHYALMWRGRGGRNGPGKLRNSHSSNNSFTGLNGLKKLSNSHHKKNSRGAEQEKPTEEQSKKSRLRSRLKNDTLVAAFTFTSYGTFHVFWGWTKKANKKKRKKKQNYSTQHLKMIKEEV